MDSCGESGGTREGELHRTVEVLKNINNEQGLKFVLYFLVDLGYSTKDIKDIADLMK